MNVHLIDQLCKQPIFHECFEVCLQNNEHSDVDVLFNTSKGPIGYDIINAKYSSLPT